MESCSKGNILSPEFRLSMTDMPLKKHFWIYYDVNITSCSTTEIWNEPTIGIKFKVILNKRKSFLVTSLHFLVAFLQIFSENVKLLRIYPGIRFGGPKNRFLLGSFTTSLNGQYCYFQRNDFVGLTTNSR